MNAATLTESPRDWQARFRSSALESLFDQTFCAWRTRLVGGAAEPFYKPAGGDSEEHVIFYTRDYFRSALHEVAHWCVAGPRRRLLPDYGYWYAPDGRSPDQQRAFESVEVLPQALELLFCAACGHPFRVSLDNLEGQPGDEQRFAEAVVKRAGQLLPNPGQRAARWLKALAGRYGDGEELGAEHIRRVLK